MSKLQLINAKLEQMLVSSDWRLADVQSQKQMQKNKLNQVKDDSIVGTLNNNPINPVLKQSKKTFNVYFNATI